MGANWTLSSPLSRQQKLVWSLLRQGLSAAAIATKLRTTRQFVNQTKLAAEAKLSATLLDVAQANDIHVTKISPNEGLLVGYHPGVGHKAIVTYSTRHGVKVWYWHDDPERVTNEEFLKHARTYLLDLARERHIDLKGDAEKLHPGKLAQSVFSELIPELKP